METTSSESSSTGDEDLIRCRVGDCVCPDMIEELKEQLEREENDKIQAATLGLSLVEENKSLRTHCDELESELKTAIEANRALRSQLRCLDNSFFEEEEANTSREEDLKEEVQRLQTSLKIAQQDGERLRAELESLYNFFDEAKAKLDTQKLEKKNLQDCLNIANSKKKKILRDKQILHQKNAQLKQQLNAARASNQEISRVRRQSQKLLKQNIAILRSSQSSCSSDSCSCIVFGNQQTLPSPIFEELEELRDSTFMEAIQTHSDSNESLSTPNSPEDTPAKASTFSREPSLEYGDALVEMASEALAFETCPLTGSSSGPSISQEDCCDVCVLNNEDADDDDDEDVFVVESPKRSKTSRYRLRKGSRGYRIEKTIEPLATREWFASTPSVLGSHTLSEAPHHCSAHSKLLSNGGAGSCGDISNHKEGSVLMEELGNVRELMRDLKRELEDMRNARLESEAEEHFRRGFNLAEEIRRAGEPSSHFMDYLDLALPHADMRWTPEKQKTWRDFLMNPFRFIWNYVITSIRNLSKKDKTA